MKNGTCWLDEAGRPIQAHGGMITRFGEKWYWYGEDKGAPNALLPDGSVSRRVDVIGISCYSSDDLHSWRREGLALAGQQAGYLAGAITPWPARAAPWRTGRRGPLP